MQLNLKNIACFILLSILALACVPVMQKATPVHVPEMYTIVPPTSTSVPTLLPSSTPTPTMTVVPTKTAILLNVFSQPIATVELPFSLDTNLVFFEAYTPSGDPPEPGIPFQITMRYLNREGKLFGPPEFLIPYEQVDAYFSDPVLSPNGRWLIFTIWDAGYAGANFYTKTFVADLLTEQVIQVDTDGMYENFYAGSPAWSPDSKQFVFALETRDTPARLFLWNMDTQQRLPLITSDSIKVLSPIMHPAWSPDGKWIAFFQGRDEDKKLCFIHPGGTGFQEISDAVYPETISYGGQNGEATMAWSPNGEWIAYMGMDTSKTGTKIPRLRIYNMATKELRWLTDRSLPEMLPAWSPDSSSIVYVSSLEKNEKNIFVASLDGKAPLQLTTIGKNIRPIWSADGKHIFFLSNQGEKDSYLMSLYVMRLDGSQQTRLIPGYVYSNVYIFR